MEEFKNNRKEVLGFVQSLNKEVLDGFDISLAAESMYDTTKRAPSNFLPLNIKEVWFKKKYPLSRVDWVVTYPKDESLETQEQATKIEIVARAIVFCDGHEFEIGNAVAVMYADDEVVKDIPKDNGKRYDMMKSLCIGTARSKALFNAGFGREFYGEEDDLQLLQELEAEKKQEQIKEVTTKIDPTSSIAVNPMSSDTSSSFVPVPDMRDSLGVDADSIMDFIAAPKKTTRSGGGFQNTLDNYFEEVLGLVPDASGKLVKGENACMLDEVYEQNRILEDLPEDSPVAAEARKQLEKCEKRLEKINAWIAKRSTVKMDQLYRGEERIPLNMEQLTALAMEKKSISESKDADDEDICDTAAFDMSDEYIDSMAVYCDAISEEPQPDFSFNVNDSDYLEQTNIRTVRCTSEKGNYMGRTYGSIAEENPELLSYLLDENTPNAEADAICKLAAELAKDDKFKPLYESILRKNELRKDFFEDGTGDFS